jgi:hypothetical protein
MTDAFGVALNLGYSITLKVRRFLLAVSAFAVSLSSDIGDGLTLL